jgi:hypothetical protein
MFHKLLRGKTVAYINSIWLFQYLVAINITLADFDIESAITL